MALGEGGGRTHPHDDGVLQVGEGRLEHRGVELVVPPGARSSARGGSSEYYLPAAVGESAGPRRRPAQASHRSRQDLPLLPRMPLAMTDQLRVPWIWMSSCSCRSSCGQRASSESVVRAAPPLSSREEVALCSRPGALGAATRPRLLCWRGWPRLVRACARALPDCAGRPTTGSAQLHLPRAAAPPPGWARAARARTSAVHVPFLRPFSSPLLSPSSGHGSPFIAGPAAAGVPRAAATLARLQSGASLAPLKRCLLRQRSSPSVSFLHGTLMAPSTDGRPSRQHRAAALHWRHTGHSLAARTCFGGPCAARRGICSWDCVQAAPQSPWLDARLSYQPSATQTFGWLLVAGVGAAAAQTRAQRVRPRPARPAHWITRQICSSQDFTTGHSFRPLQNEQNSTVDTRPAHGHDPAGLATPRLPALVTPITKTHHRQPRLPLTTLHSTRPRGQGAHAQ